MARFLTAIVAARIISAAAVHLSGEDLARIDDLRTSSNYGVKPNGVASISASGFAIECVLRGAGTSVDHSRAHEQSGECAGGGVRHPFEHYRIEPDVIADDWDSGEK
jgi:hypothetical protein